MNLRRRPTEPPPPITVHGREVETAVLERGARLVEDACEWRPGTATHPQHHYGFPCPYHVAAALLRGLPDPRDPR